MYKIVCTRAKLLQSRLMLCDPMDPARLLGPRDSPGQNTGVGGQALLQGIFPTHRRHREQAWHGWWGRRGEQGVWRVTWRHELP